MFSAYWTAICSALVPLAVVIAIKAMESNNVVGKLVAFILVIAGIYSFIYGWRMIREEARKKADDN